MTSARTIAPGEARTAGSERTYTRLSHRAGEDRIRRTDLGAESPAAADPRPLLTFGYFTDIHIQDHQSPARFEFVDRLYGPAPLHLLAPAYRPQEFLQPFAVEAMIRTLNAIKFAPRTGTPLQFLLCTGDLTDNSQRNELEWAVCLLQGGKLDLRSGGAAYEGVASADWGDEAYWHPDGIEDDYKRRWGFPSYPGLIDDAYQSFDAQGIQFPWQACMGNHDALVQGTALWTKAMRSLACGDRKVVALPGGFNILANLEHYITAPESFLSGRYRQVTADTRRANIDKATFLALVSRAAGTPTGHGFHHDAVASDQAYYVDDTYAGMRIICLDTVNIGGNYDGSVGAAQFAWLEDRLIEVHSRAWDRAGRSMRSGNTDRLVIVVSHHGIEALVNDLVLPETEHDLPRVLGPTVEALLHRFPNVILWVNGHTHRNTIMPRPDPTGVTGGFWEVTTSSLLDWPCQARLIELADNQDGTLSIFCTLVDHDAPPDPRRASGLWRLAAIHRELAANDPHDGVAGGNQGTVLDRNVELRLKAPFDLG